jgi:hypothetical protein
MGNTLSAFVDVCLLTNLQITPSWSQPQSSFHLLLLFFSTFLAIAFETKTKISSQSHFFSSSTKIAPVPCGCLQRYICVHHAHECVYRREQDIGVNFVTSRANDIARTFFSSLSTSTMIENKWKSSCGLLSMCVHAHRVTAASSTFCAVLSLFLLQTKPNRCLKLINHIDLSWASWRTMNNSRVHSLTLTFNWIASITSFISS